MIESNELIEVSEAQELETRSEREGAQLTAEPVPPANENGALRPTFDIGEQANQILGLIHDLKALTDRACDTALREVQYSAQVEEMASAELISLRLQLKEKDEALEARDRIIRDREALAKETIDSLERTLTDKQAQLDNSNARANALLQEIDGLNLRLNEAVMAMRQAESRFRDFAEHHQSKIAALQDDIKLKEQTLVLTEAALKELDEESRLTIAALESRLQNSEKTLQAKEMDLHEKQTALQTASFREEAFSRLMQQLTAESRKLMAELQEKSRVVAELESKTYRGLGNLAGWNQTTSQERLL